MRWLSLILPLAGTAGKLAFAMPSSRQSKLQNRAGIRMRRERVSPSRRKIKIGLPMAKRQVCNTSTIDKGNSTSPRSGTNVR